MRSGPDFSRMIGLRATRAAMLSAAAMLFGGASPASAQELVHRFINPSFGGNPFYSEHLLGIANIHRPDEPEEPAADPPTQEELLARQIRERLLGQLSDEIEEQIQDAQPGESGTFDLGNQRISFTRTATETRVTFTDTATGETQVVVLPVQGSSGAFATSVGAFSAEQALGAGGTSLTPTSSMGLALPPL